MQSTYVCRATADLQDRWSNSLGARQDTRAGNAVALLLLRAEANMGAGRYFEAIADSGKVLKRESGNLDAYLMRGRAHYMLGEHDMAKRHAQEGLRMDPEHVGCKTLFRLLRRITKLEKQATDEEKHGRYEQAIATVCLAVLFGCYICGSAHAVPCLAVPRGCGCGPIAPSLP